MGGQPSAAVPPILHVPSEESILDADGSVKDLCQVTVDIHDESQKILKQLNETFADLCSHQSLLATVPDPSAQAPRVLLLAFLRMAPSRHWQLCWNPL